MVTGQVTSLRQKRKYFKDTAEYHRKYMREYYEKNKEEIRAKEKEEREERKKKIEEWLMDCDKNPLCSLFHTIIKGNRNK